MFHELLIVCCVLNQCDTIIFMGGNVLENLEEALRIRFCGFKFCGVYYTFFADNLVHAMRILVSTRNL